MSAHTQDTLPGKGDHGRMMKVSVRFLVYLSTTFGVALIAWYIAVLSFDRQCGGGDCDLSALYASGVAIIAFGLAVLGCVVADALYRRSTRHWP
jgi:hypothetical protein